MLMVIFETVIKKILKNRKFPYVIQTKVIVLFRMLYKPCWNMKVNAFIKRLKTLKDFVSAILYKYLKRNASFKPN